MSRTDEINAELEKLYKERQEIFNREDREKILKMDWLLECDLYFREEMLKCAVIPYYKLELTGNTPKCHKSVKLYGNSPNYQENILYNSSSFSFNGSIPIISTNNFELLIEFLKKVKYRSLKFDTGFYERLSLIKECSK